MSTESSLTFAFEQNASPVPVNERAARMYVRVMPATSLLPADRHHMVREDSPETRIGEQLGALAYRHG